MPGQAGRSGKDIDQFLAGKQADCQIYGDRAFEDIQEKNRDTEFHAGDPKDIGKTDIPAAMLTHIDAHECPDNPIAVRDGPDDIATKYPQRPEKHEQPSLIRSVYGPGARDEWESRRNRTAHTGD